ncbi:MAG: glutamine synthetase family protein [Gammaproteobacteria bacterium]|nr:glutamine synthetase family protein [Gammaproteobacteria bacterium]
MQDWIEKNQISEIECIVPDMAGAARGKLVPASKFNGDSVLRLPESIFMQTISGEYPDLQEVINPLDADLILQPDPGTLRRLPWAKASSAQVIHDCFDKQGQPAKIAPRQVLQQVVELYRKQGWDPVIAPELEFYLLKQNSDPNLPLQPPKGRSGRTESSGQAFNLDATYEYQPVLDDMYTFAAAQQLQIDTFLHEEGKAQMEINLLHGDPVELADQAFLLKRTVREAALRNDIYATFMAKPIEHQPGNAMHIHQSVVDLESRENLFSTPDGEPNQLLLSHIGGLQTLLPQAQALMAPYVNSYRRFVREMSAPINSHWGFDNRTVGFRVPDNDPASMRIENRIASADVNPYIAIATSLACGYIGMKQSMKASQPLLESAYSQPSDLSRNWYQALQRLSDSQALREVLGDEFIDLYVAIKEVEFEEFLNTITPWEREHLLLRV